MNKDRLIEVALLAAIVCGLVYAFFFNRQPLLDNDEVESVATVLGDDVIVEPPVQPSSSNASRRRSITEHVVVESNAFATLPHVTYRFQTPLIPKARLIGMRVLDNTLWFSGDNGLVSFDLNSEEWFIYDKNNGLPGDTAYEIEVVDGELIFGAYNWSAEGSLTSTGSYRFASDEFKPLKAGIKEIEAGFYPSAKNAGLSGGANDVIHYKGDVWVAFRGKHLDREKDFKDGGLAQFNTKGGLVKAHTQADGIHRSYAFKMTVMSDDSLWLSHFHEEHGLSVLYPKHSTWETVERSTNNIELGGVSLGSINDILVIGQQRGVVFYDTVSRQAYFMDQSMGLPGNIVTGIQTVGKTVWVSAFNYHDGDRFQRSTGLTRFDYRDIEALFR